MTRQSFNTKVRQKTDITSIDLYGEINAFAEEALTAAYDEASSYKTKTIALNFTEVSYINSTGIALIVGLLAQARKTHRTLIVFGLSEHYEEIFRITRLADFMEIYPDETSAMAIA